MFIAEAFAQDAANGGSSLVANILPLVLIIAVFYLLIIRPQSKKIKAHEELVRGVKKGDEVVTAGGIMGKIVKADSEKNIAEVEIASGVKIKVRQTTISDVVK